MKLLMFITADYASVEPVTGKLNILGAFNRIMATRFPVQHRAMSIVAKLGGEIGDSSGQHVLTLVLADEDGNQLLHVAAPFNMPKTPAEISPEHNIILELRDFVFPHPGSYQLSASLDGQWLDSAGIELVLAQEQE